MKYFNLFLVSLSITTCTIQAQTLKEFFSGKDIPVYWLGIDFSQSQLIGDFAQFFGAGEKDAAQMTSRYFPAWNELVLKEPNKYDVKAMVKKYNAKYDIDYIMARNAAANTNKLEVYNHQAYDDSYIRAIVSQYDFKKRDGYGMFFVCELLNKTTKEAYFHFVVVNMQTGACLFTARLRGEPSGFGIRNYWGGAVYDVIKGIQDRHYRTWVKKYG